MDLKMTDSPADATHAVVAFLNHWLSEEEGRSWLAAYARYAGSIPPGSEAPDPSLAVRAAVAELLEAKRVVDLYQDNDQEGPDPFTVDLAALLQAFPSGGPGVLAGGEPAQSLLRMHTKELLERCQRRPRRVAGSRDAELAPLLGAAEGIPRRRKL